jgi:hypothetical protein
MAEEVRKKDKKAGKALDRERAKHKAELAEAKKTNVMDIMNMVGTGLDLY